MFRTSCASPTAPVETKGAKATPASQAHLGSHNLEAGHQIVEMEECGFGSRLNCSQFQSFKPYTSEIVVQVIHLFIASSLIEIMNVFVRL